MQPFYQPGTYRCEITGQAMGESSKGNPQFVLRFRVLEQLGGAAGAAPVQQYERSHYRSITERTAQYFAQDLRTLGYPHNSFKQLDPRVDGFHDFTGQSVEMFCNHDDDQNGNPREQWGIVSTGGAPPVKPLSGQKLRQLDNLFGKHLTAIPAPVTDEITDDDIPF